jgi:hypothetical protein
MRALYGGVGLRLGLSLFLSLGLCLWLSGCGGDGGGVPPEIRALTLGATTNPVGDEEAIHGVFEFSDADGDAESIAFEVLLPDGTVQVLPPQAVQGLDNQPLGTVSFSLSYSRDGMGRYEVTVWLVDAQGLESNRLTGTIVSRM